MIYKYHEIIFRLNINNLAEGSILFNTPNSHSLFDYFATWFEQRNNHMKRVLANNACVFCAHSHRGSATHRIYTHRADALYAAAAARLTVA
jgi:hypothetical protein